MERRSKRKNLGGVSFLKKVLILLLLVTTFFITTKPTHAFTNNQLIIINKTTNELAFFDKNELVRTFSVGTGRTNALTPEGTFQIVNKIKNRPYYTGRIPGGDPRNPLGDRWLGLNARGTWGTTYAIHGNSNPNSIGGYVSAGCVRMYNDEVRWLFDQVKVGTTVIITHSNKNFVNLAASYGYETQNFYEVTQDATIYDNSTGKLVRVGVLRKGEVFPVKGDSGNWLRIDFGGKDRFVYKPASQKADVTGVKNLNTQFKNSNKTITTNRDAAVYDNSSGSLVPFATIAKGETYPIVSDFGANWYRVIVSGRIGFVYKLNTVEHSSVEKPSVEQPPVKEVNLFKATENVVVYETSSMEAKQIGTLLKGEVYKQIGEKEGFVQVQFGSDHGYVPKDVTEQASGELPKNFNKNFETSDQYVKVKNNAPVYDNSSGSLVAFARIQAGETYPVVSNFGPNWYRVLLGDRIGFIYAPNTIIVQDN